MTKLVWHIWSGMIKPIREDEVGNTVVLGDCVHGSIEEAVDCAMQTLRLPPHQIRQEYRIYDKGLFLLQIGTDGSSVLWLGPDREGYTAELDCAGVYYGEELAPDDCLWPREAVINLASLHVNAGKLSS